MYKITSIGFCPVCLPVCHKSLCTHPSNILKVNSLIFVFWLIDIDIWRIAYRNSILIGPFLKEKSPFLTWNILSKWRRGETYIFSQKQPFMWYSNYDNVLKILIVMIDNRTKNKNIKHISGRHLFSKVEMKIKIPVWNFVLVWDKHTYVARLIWLLLRGSHPPPPPMLSRSTKANWKQTPKKKLFGNFSKWPVLRTLSYYWLKF